MPVPTTRALAAADVRAAAAAGRRELAVPPHARVTPLARDTARELGVLLVPARPPEPAPAPPSAGAAAIRHVDAREIALDPFPYPGPEPGQDVRVGDVVDAGHGSPMAAGFLTLTRGCFPWTLTYDEIEYVVEGELHLGIDGTTIVGHPGDVLYVPKGSAITFGTPSWARILYVTYPADWEGSR
ncbi:cupin domain-containing protein [Nocardioides humi]|uniref:Ethanolamine utilization protein EutQ n=1 Tax=Nocardioides humi TaxID=449461 RepID=A0ABN2BJE4_9ACTN|nr:cupin domain-containing protein [Nocardioides humi]